MSLNKSITHGKEYRKPYRGAKSIDLTCRNHGSCGWCKGNGKMTIKELYEEAVEKGTEDCEIRLQYQDGGGCYSGSCLMEEMEYDDLRKEVTLA